MNSHFEVLGFLASEFTQLGFITVVSGLVVRSKVEFVNDSSMFALITIGAQMGFEVSQNDDAITMPLPNESNLNYAARIANLIREYN